MNINYRNGIRWIKNHIEWDIIIKKITLRMEIFFLLRRIFSQLLAMATNTYTYSAASINSISKICMYDIYSRNIRFEFIDRDFLLISCC
jgi:hypothetical protein